VYMCVCTVRMGKFVGWWIPYEGKQSAEAAPEDTSLRSHPLVYLGDMVSKCARVSS
jgi:hypothetical protein